MDVKLIAHTRLSDEFLDEIYPIDESVGVNERAAVALTAIRTCYSPLKPTEILPTEGAKYFRREASDGEGGTDADRLFRHIWRSKHASTLEHITYTFAIEGVSRSLLAQLTRHRQFSFSVQSQRYVRFGRDDKSGGFDYVTPPSITRDKRFNVGSFFEDDAESLFDEAMAYIQAVYDRLREAGVPAEDARYVLPNAAACNLVMTGNLRAYLEFYNKRRSGSGAQHEIANLAERIREEITKVDEWTTKFFEGSE
ncbi:thymidylate synthase (FAD) [Paenibacillus cisolokensis]|uniref:Flavin-dependent thymidylate synthase n=1 Tax=Paenibacillus cisolokensis TaxID=1658519 RepID=A0ABQ4N679_9BACL|nr:FAD-dependent thymidylate synthase [Paenibacillus cisolokensis]GIQ63677.1 thymidylate synthase (FAD) [Paenibacillus cisolokensis]